jgi:drug/metabolite transporter (DMT)-like permease|eukprot:Stramenopile-MAST_4_protein_3253
MSAEPQIDTLKGPKIFSDDSILRKLNPYVPHIAMAYVMCCFAGYTCMGRHLRGEGPMFEPLVFLLIRHWGSAGLITIYVACKEGLVIPRKRDRLRLMLCGSLGISGTHLLFIYGLRATTATTAACLEPLIPCVVFALALVHGKEKCESSRNFFFKMLGLLIGCGGAILTTLGHSRTDIHVTGVGNMNRHVKIKHWVGDSAILLQCFTLAMYIIWTKDLVKIYSPMWLTGMFLIAGAMFTTFVTLLSLLACEGHWPGWESWKIHETFWLEASYAIMIASVQNYALRTWAMKYIKSTTVSMYFCLDPPATALLAYVSLGEQIHFVQMCGGGLILSGMYMTIHYGEKMKEPVLDKGNSRRRSHDRIGDEESREDAPLMLSYRSSNSDIDSGDDRYDFQSD